MANFHIFETLRPLHVYTFNQTWRSLSFIYNLLISSRLNCDNIVSHLHPFFDQKIYANENFSLCLPYVPRTHFLAFKICGDVFLCSQKAPPKFIVNMRKSSYEGRGKPFQFADCHRIKYLKPCLRSLHTFHNIMYIY